MDPRVKELRLMRWKEIIVACNTSGMTKKAWLEANHINPKTFYRKQREIRESELNRMELANLDANKTSAWAICGYDHTLEIKRKEPNHFKQTRKNYCRDIAAGDDASSWAIQYLYWKQSY